MPPEARELTFEEAVHRAGVLLASSAAVLNKSPAEYHHGWVFYGTSHKPQHAWPAPGHTPEVCVAVNKSNGRMYRLSPPNHTWLQCPHREQVKQFETCGRVGNPANRTWQWIKLRVDGCHTDDEARRIVSLVSENTRLDVQAADRLLTDVVRSGGRSEMLRCLSEEHEEDCVCKLRDLSSAIGIRHSLMRILVDESTLTFH